MGTEVALGTEGAWVSTGVSGTLMWGRKGHREDTLECRGVEKGKAGSSQQGLGMLTQPGLGAHLVLISKDCCGLQTKSSSQAGCGCIKCYRSYGKSSAELRTR